MILSVELEEEVQQVGEVVVKSSRRKTGPTMTWRSSVPFLHIEEPKNTPEAAAMWHAWHRLCRGIVCNDSRNDIVIRGNSPSGLLWRLEDIDLPNPNHFAENGTTGGP